MKDIIKVLLVSPYSSQIVGGIGTWSKSVLDAFAECKSIDILFQNTKSILKIIPKSHVSRLIKGSVDTLVILAQLFLNCLLRRPDIIHYTSSASWALNKDRIAIRIAKLFKIPFIVHWHFGRIPDIIKEKGSEYFRLRTVLKLATASICIDKMSFEALENDGIDHCFYIPNALPDNVLVASGKTAERNREEGVVLFVGHVIKTKGVYELVKSCTIIPSVKKLLIVGPCNEVVKNELNHLAKKREDGKWMCFLGEIPREQVFDYYRNCSVFVLPSYTEGFPYVVLEAMAFGCPIVATAVGAIPQLITQSTGLLIPAQNEEKLSEAIALMINNKDKAYSCGANARDMVVQHFSTTTVMKQYEHLWRLICKVEKSMI